LLEKLEALSAKSLSIRIETQVIAVNLKAGIAKLEDSMCRGSLAWLGRQTHNLEFERGKRPTTRSRGLESRPRHHCDVVVSFLFCESNRN
jgi:hypothetical protein